MASAAQDVPIAAGHQVAHVRTGLGDPQQSGFVVDQPVELLGRHPGRSGEEPRQARVDIPRSRAHHNPGGGRQGHGRINGPPPVDGRQTRPTPQVHRTTRPEAASEPASWASTSIR